MSSLVTRGTWLACGLALLGAVIAWVLVLIPADTEELHAPAAEGMASSAAATAPETLGPSTATDPTVHAPTHQVQSLDELLGLCHDFWQNGKEFSPACMAALDRRYLDGLVDEGFGYPRVVDSLTWREVFDGAVHTRSSVVEALRNPDCRVPNGSIRPDLRESCAADEMVRLAVLQQKCGQALTMDDHYGGVHDGNWEWQLDHVSRQASDQDDYYRRRSDAEEQQLRFAWSLRRCRLARGGVEWIDTLPLPGGGMTDADQGWHLAGAAARLGNPRAMLAYPFGDEAHLNALAAFDPAIAYCHLARRSQSPEHEAYILVARHYNETLRRGAALDWAGLSWSQGRIANHPDDEISVRARRIIVAGWRPLSEPPPPERVPEHDPDTVVRRVGDHVIVHGPAAADDGEETGVGIDWL